MGTWDPVLPRHKALFKKLISYSKKKALNPYIIIFYPNPANFIHENRYKDYFDLDARIELFKHLQPEFPTAKYILITGEMSYEMAESTRQLGFDALILKPFDFMILEDNISGLLSAAA